MGHLLKKKGGGDGWMTLDWYLVSLSWPLKQKPTWHTFKVRQWLLHGPLVSSFNFQQGSCMQSFVVQKSSWHTKTWKPLKSSCNPILILTSCFVLHVLLNMGQLRSPYFFISSRVDKKYIRSKISCLIWGYCFYSMEGHDHAHHWENKSNAIIKAYCEHAKCHFWFLLNQYAVCVCFQTINMTH